MDLNKYEIAHYLPYRKEAMYCFTLDIVIVVVICVLFFVMEIQFYMPVLFLILPTYFIIESFFNYRLALLSFFEVCKNSYMSKDVYIVDINIENSASGHWGSIISKLYPKAVGMERYKIICVDTNNVKLTLRSAMSNKNSQLLTDGIRMTKPLKRTVVFGRYSHIVLKYLDDDDLAFILNRKL